jgi:hypothetical protein
MDGNAYRRVAPTLARLEAPGDGVDATYDPEAATAPAATV